MLKYLKARDSKIKLLYTLNVFRAVQKRITLELREMGTRDRILGDCNYLGPMENSKDEDYDTDDEEKDEMSKQDTQSVTNKSKFTDTTFSALYKPNSLQEKELPRML
jgi:hypothetical protein